MREYAQASIQLDQLKIISDTDCCLIVQGIISKSGVYDYPEGPTLKPQMELLKATRTARYAKLAVGSDHPDTEVVCQQDQLFGGVEKPFWDRNKMRANLNFDKSVTPKRFLERIRSAARGGKPLNNSIGFYYKADWTPGTGPDVNTGKIRPYVRIMRDILIDHVLVGDFVGRCRSPQCGIGIGIDRGLRVQNDIVGKKGEEWCVFHCNPDGSRGGVIKCFPTKDQADAMHRAIQARKHGSAADFYMNIHKLIDVDTLDEATYQLFFGVTNERPPKEWMDSCMSKAEGFAKEPGAFCNWLYNSGPEELKRSFGSSNVSKLGGKKGLSQEEKSEEAYQACLTKEKDGGATPEEATETCKPLKPIEKPAETPEGAEEVEEGTPWQKCIIKYTSDPHNLSMADAIKKCKAEKIVQTDQEQTEEEAFKACVVGKIEVEGMTKEQAEEACKPEVTETLLGALAQESHEEPIEQLEELPTPLEQCISGRMTATECSEEEAEAWCKDELAGLHQPADEIVTDILDLKAKEEKLSRRK